VLILEFRFDGRRTAAICTFHTLVVITVLWPDVNALKVERN
jgi:hypothetical protein